MNDMARDLYRRKKLMRKKYSRPVLQRLAKQYGFSDINDENFINLILPPDSVNAKSDIDSDDLSTEDKYTSMKKKAKILHRKDIQYSKDGSSTSGEIEFDVIKAGMYKELVTMNNAEREMEHPVIVQIEPTDEERQTGFMFRYFLQQENSPSAPIIEVDKEQYEGWLKIGGGIDRTFYNGVVVKWRIRGSLETVTGDDGIIRKGVLEGNTASIDLASETLPAIKTQVVNLVKFWKR